MRALRVDDGSEKPKSVYEISEFSRNHLGSSLLANQIPLTGDVVMHITVAALDRQVIAGLEAHTRCCARRVVRGAFAGAR